MKQAWPCFIYRLLQETLDREEIRETALPLLPAQSLTGQKASSFWPGSETPPTPAGDGDGDGDNHSFNSQKLL